MESQRRNRNLVHTRVNRSNQLPGWLVALCVLAAGCGHAPQTAEGASRSVVADIIVSVSNQTSRRMLIYLEAGATEHSLGEVPERSSRSFSVPSGLGSEMGALRFEARQPRATTGFRSGVFSLAPGQQALWTFDESGSRTVTTR